MSRLVPSQVEALSAAIRAKLRDKDSSFAKNYLRAVVSEIRVTGRTATIQGSYRQLMALAGKKKEDTNQVPSFFFLHDWRPGRTASFWHAGNRMRRPL